MKLRNKTAIITFLLGAVLLIALSTLFYHINRHDDIEHAYEMSHSGIHENINDIEILLIEEANKALTLSINPFIVESVIKSNRIYNDYSNLERTQRINAIESQWAETLDPSDTFFDEYLSNPVSNHFQAIKNTAVDKYGEIFLTNRYGLIVASSNRTSNFDQSGEEWWKNCTTSGKIFFDDRGFDLSVYDYVFGVTLPIKVDDDVIGVIKFNLRSISIMKEVFSDQHHSVDRRILVARAGGLILFDSYNPDNVYKEKLPSRLVDLLEPSNIGNTIFTDDETGDMVTSYSVIPLSTGKSSYGFGGTLTSGDHWLGSEAEELYVIHQQPMSIAIANSRQNTVQLIQVGILLILCMSIITIITSGSLFRPMKQLVDYTRRIGQGNFEGIMPVSAHDEISDLTESFNQMALNLQQTMISRDFLVEEVERREKTESALRESETRYRELFDNMRNGVAVYKPVDGGVNFIVTDLNNAGQQICKVSKSAVIGKHITEGFSGVEEMGLLEVLRRVSKSGKSEWFPLKYYRDDHLSLWAENYVYRLPSGEVIAVFEDRTAQKYAESVIERIFTLSPDLICTAGFDGYFKKINPAFVTTLGYTEDMILGQPLLNFVHPDDVKQTQSIINKKLSQGLPAYNFENRYLCIDGTYRWINWVATPVTEEKTIYAIGRDITDNKQAEEQILKLARFPEENINPVMRISSDGTVIYANKASECLLECWHTEREQPLPDSIKQVVLSSLSEDMAQSFETECMDRTYKLSFVPIATSGFVNIYAMDITDRILAEQALRDSEEKFRILSEQSLMGIFIFHNNSILYANMALVDIYELSLDNISSFDFEVLQQYIHPDDRAFIVDQIQKINTIETKGIVNDYIHRLVTSTGKVKWIELHVKTIIYGSKPANLVTMLDITERKQLEEQVAQAQKMESIGRLAGGIAHDFNNILTAILGNAELVIASIPADSELIDDITEIKSTAERAANLTRQLLAFSRRQIVEPKVLNLNILLPDIDRMLRRLIGENVILETKLDEDLWDIKIDPGQINQILTNLVVNARDAIPDTGTITIETANVVLDGDYIGNHADTKLGDYVMLAVSDTGVGMDENTRAQIFEPFFTTKDKERGTGLGLSTCYGIVKQNKGNIWVYSEPGHGTTLKIYLPRVHESTVHIEQVSQKPVSLSGTETILVVEDEPAVRKIIVRTLSEQGYHIIEAVNGLEAIAAAKSTTDINLMITDVIMPKVGGRELAEKLTSTIPNLKVIFISGYTANSIVHKGFLEDGIKFLQKPFYPTSLLTKIRQVLDESE